MGKRDPECLRIKDVRLVIGMEMELEKLEGQKQDRRPIDRASLLILVRIPSLAAHAINSGN